MHSLKATVILVLLSACGTTAAKTDDTCTTDNECLSGQLCDATSKCAESTLVQAAREKKQADEAASKAAAAKAAQAKKLETLAGDWKLELLVSLSDTSFTFKTRATMTAMTNDAGVTFVLPWCNIVAKLGADDRLTLAANQSCEKAAGTELELQLQGAPGEFEEPVPITNSCYRVTFASAQPASISATAMTFTEGSGTGVSCESGDPVPVTLTFTFTR